MGDFYIRLPSSARDALLQLALREYRHPRDQAAILLLDSLRRAGALPEEPDTREVPHGSD